MKFLLWEKWGIYRLLSLPGRELAVGGEGRDGHNPCAQVAHVAFVVQFQAVVPKEAGNAPFCRSQEKFHTVVLRGVRNTSGAP